MQFRPRNLKIALLSSALILSACASGGGGGGGAPQAANNVPNSSGGSGGAGGGSESSSGGGDGGAGIVASDSNGGSIVIVSEFFGPVYSGGGCFICAPDPATDGENATAVVIAENDGNGPAEGTAFPLIQSVVEITENGIGPDEDANEGGATLTVLDLETGETNLSIPSLGIDVVLSANADSPTENADGFVALAGATGNYLMVGSWGAAFDDSAKLAAFVTGYRTPSDHVPLSGTANFNGENNVVGSVIVEGTGNTADVGIILGDAAFTANFAAGTVDGAFTNMIAIGADGVATDWNDVSVTASIGSVGGVSTLAGTTGAANAPGTPFALSGSADGHFNGGLFGPNAEELGAVWSLADGSGAALGTVAAGREGAGDGAGIYATTSDGDIEIEFGNVSAEGIYSSGVAARAGGIGEIVVTGSD